MLCPSRIAPTVFSLHQRRVPEASLLRKLAAVPHLLGCYPPLEPPLPVLVFLVDARCSRRLQRVADVAEEARRTSSGRRARGPRTERAVVAWPLVNTCLRTHQQRRKLAGQGSRGWSRGCWRRRRRRVYGPGRAGVDGCTRAMRRQCTPQAARLGRAVVGRVIAAVGGPPGHRGGVDGEFGGFAGCTTRQYIEAGS